MTYTQSIAMRPGSEEWDPYEGPSLTDFVASRQELARDLE